MHRPQDDDEVEAMQKHVQEFMTHDDCVLMFAVIRDDDGLHSRFCAAGDEGTDPHELYRMMADVTERFRVSLEKAEAEAAKVVAHVPRH